MNVSSGPGSGTDGPGADQCTGCGRTVPSRAGQCPHCGRPFAPDDAFTIVSANAITMAPAGVTAETMDGPTFAPTPSPESPTTRIDSGPLKTGEPFGARYHIIRQLGIGGMGAVYQAWDADLSVAVALKVIRPEVMADARVAAEVERRFKRELLLARQVTHRNVVRIHDLGDINGIKYITMSYIDGVDLATQIKRNGAQSVADVLRLARDVVPGLISAHGVGVVHRDLKPANIMLQRDGEALIMDFGIALSTGAAKAEPAGTMALPDKLRRTATQYAVTTMVGIVGTVEYMAPEQARGETVDQRADIYAFGLILLDALTGQRRSTGASAIEELQRRMVESVPPVRTQAPAVPAPLEALIMRCLDPDPTKRYQTSLELAADLARLDDRGELIPVRRYLTSGLMAAAGVLVIGLLAGTFFLTRRVVQPTQDEPVSVVIADVENRTGDPAFDGTLEPMLKRSLEGAPFVTAFDRNVIRRTLGVLPPERLDAAAANEIALKQGLGVVLAASIAPQGSGYTLSVRANQAVSGNVILNTSRRATRKEDVLEVMNDLVASVRNALGDEISDSDELFARTTLSATSLDVAREYAAAQDAAARNDFAQAHQHASKAIELDPQFGIGYQLLAVVSQNLRRLDDSQKYSNEALRFIGSMTERERLTTRGFRARVTGDYKLCQQEYGELIKLYSADIVGHNQFALCQTQLRHLAPAVESMKRVVQIVPNLALFRVNLAWYIELCRRLRIG